MGRTGMKWIDNITAKIEWVALNVFGLSSAGWLAQVQVGWSTVIASIVGLTVIALNIVKIRGAILDNKAKRKALKDAENDIQEKL